MIKVRIERVDDEGAGVAEEPGVGPVRVPLALPGEEVRAVVEHRSPHQGRGAWARLIEVTAPSPERVPPACAAWGRCGGCVLQHWAYPSQLAWKRARLAVAVGLPVEPCVASPRPLQYRNRAKLVFATGPSSRTILGAYAPRSHEVVDLAGCAVVEPPLDEVAVALARLTDERRVTLFDEKRGDGDLRYALLRVNHRGQVQVALVVTRPAVPAVAQLAAALAAARPEVVSVVENLNPAPGNVLVGRAAPDVALVGELFLDEEVGGVRLRVGPRSFLQVNRGVAAKIYADVAAGLALVDGERVTDVYCGVGGIGLTLARAAAAPSLLGIEENEEAVAAARAAAALNQVARTRFVAGDAAALLDAPTDAVVLNPPRRGVTPAVLAATLRLRPRAVAYVSCDPDTLGRDLRALVAGGYQVERVTPYDMLPHTPHVEALALLRRG